MRPAPRVLRALELRHDYDKVEVDYQRSACTGRCDDYCRCTKIESVSVRYIDLQGLSLAFEQSDPLTTYAIERVLTSMKPWKRDVLDFRAVGGYYGEELDSVSFREDFAGPADECVARLLELESPEDQLRCALEAEYGFVLDELTAAGFALEEVPRSHLILPQAQHAGSLSAKSLVPYRERRGVMGLAIADSQGLLRVVDGYHRLSATDHDPVEVIIATPGAGTPTRVPVARPRPRHRPRTLSDALRQRRGTGH